MEDSLFSISVQTLWLILGGTIFGIIVGALPGLTVNLAVAIMIPVTFYLNPVDAIAFLLAIYKSGTYGGSISAILLGTPGTPSAACTVLDGYSLAKRGYPGKALKMALYSSTFADIISNLTLILIASKIAGIALKFGPAEYTLLVLFSLIVIGGVSGENYLKGIFAAFIGLFLSLVGMDPVNGVPRFTFGSVNLLNGLSFIPVLIGLFAVSEIFVEFTSTKSNKVDEVAVEPKAGEAKISLREFLSVLKTLLKSSGIGVFMGALPGSGAAVSSFLSYSEAKRTSRKPEEFGKGSLEGIAASEAGNNAVCGATLIPLLTMGIPGDAITAILFGALVIQGLVPGPQLFETQSGTLTGIFITLFICSIFMLLIGSVFIKYLTKILNVKKNVLFPIVLILCFSGTYAANNSMFDVFVMFLFGIIGFLFKKIDIPLAPIIISFILGPMLETSFRQAMILSDGSPVIFFSSLTANIMMLLTVSAMVYFVGKAKIKNWSKEAKS